MQVSINVNVTPPRWLQTKTRRKAAALALAAALVIPGLALAGHSFSDVPAGHPFHDPISRIFGARITNGCSATEYCPADNVTRGQMAAFLARSGGRVASTTITNAEVPVTGIGTIGTLAIKAGDVTGGRAYVKVDFAFRTSSRDVGCPCSGIVIFSDASGFLQWATYSLGVLADGVSHDSGAVSAVVSVPTGVTTTFTIHAQRRVGTAATILISGTATATYFPFGAEGLNAP